MTAFNDDGVYDAALDQIALCTAIHACSSEPANHAAIAAASLGSYTVAANDGGGHWTIGNGDTSGRKLTSAALTGTNASASGTATDLAYTDGTTMHARRDLASSIALTSGQEFQIPAHDTEELRDTTPE